MSSFDPTELEEDMIVDGLSRAMRLVYPEKQSVMSKCAQWAREHLVEKYNIGSAHAIL